MRVSFRIRHPAYFGLRLGPVDSFDSLTKCVTLADSNLGRLDALDATPALAGLGQYLTHLFERVMNTAVIAESCLRHQFF